MMLLFGMGTTQHFVEAKHKLAMFDNNDFDDDFILEINNNSNTHLHYQARHRGGELQRPRRLKKSTTTGGQLASSKKSSSKKNNRFQVFELDSQFVTNLFGTQPKRYAEMETFCTDVGMELCSLEELCPYRPAYPSQLGFVDMETCNANEGSGLLPPYSFVTDDDQWIAYRPSKDDPCIKNEADNCDEDGIANTWVQIGDGGAVNPWQPCQLHCGIGDAEATTICPVWGLMDEGLPTPFLDYAVCCD